MNPIIKLLIGIDFFVFSGLGLINPIFAVFIKDNLRGGTLSAVGVSATIFLVVKALTQIPIAKFTDREGANVREFWTLLVGQGIIAVIPFLYLWIDTVYGLYGVQAFYGLGAALAFPGFMAIFTKFGDHKKAAFSWSLHSTVVLLSMAVTASVGAYIGERYGFSALLVGVGILTFLGFFTTLGLGLFYNELREVDPSGFKPFWQRVADLLRRSKHPPIPPASMTGSLPK